MQDNLAKLSIQTAFQSKNTHKSQYSARHLPATFLHTQRYQIVLHLFPPRYDRIHLLFFNASINDAPQGITNLENISLLFTPPLQIIHHVSPHLTLPRSFTPRFAKSISLHCSFPANSNPQKISISVPKCANSHPKIPEIRTVVELNMTLPR